VAKVNIVIDLITGMCPLLNIVPFTVNEQKLSNDIFAIARSGDLVIRDLGYFVTDTFRKMLAANIFFLSRYRYGVSLFDSKTLGKINLEKELSGKLSVDKIFLLGHEHKVPVRLVAIKLNECQAAERIRKAKKDRDKRLNHSKEYYVLLGYIIFITTVGACIWTHEQVAQAYRSRWNIEILFKSWKSGFNITELIPHAYTRTERVESILYLLMLFLTLFNAFIWQPLKWEIKEMWGKNISLLKTIAYLNVDLMKWWNNPVDWKDKKLIAYHCCYEKRNDRLNADQRLELFFNPLA
jgi:hypothetical protein